MGDDVETGVVTTTLDTADSLLESCSDMTYCERIAGAAAMASVFTALLLMVLVESSFANIAGVGAILMGPYFYWQQCELIDIRLVENEGTDLYDKVEEQKAENDRLKESIEEHGRSIEELKGVEEALEVASASRGDAVAELERSVQEAKANIERQKGTTKGEVTKLILEVFTRSDESGVYDGIISEEEAEKCVDSLRGLTGLSFKEEKLKELVVGKTLDAIAELLKNLTKDDLSEEENIFTLV